MKYFSDLHQISIIILLGDGPTPQSTVSTPSFDSKPRTSFRCSRIWGSRAFLWPGQHCFFIHNFSCPDTEISSTQARFIDESTSYWFKQTRGFQNRGGQGDRALVLLSPLNIQYFTDAQGYTFYYRNTRLPSRNHRDTNCVPLIPRPCNNHCQHSYLCYLTRYVETDTYSSPAFSSTRSYCHRLSPPLLG